MCRQLSQTQNSNKMKGIKTTTFEQWNHKVILIETPETAVIYSDEYTDRKEGYTRATDVRMFFNGILCQLTVAESPKYFGGNRKTNYELWDTHAVISSDGNGMKEVLRVNVPEAVILTPFGKYLIRGVKETDERNHGVNIFKGIYVTPIV